MAGPGVFHVEFGINETKLTQLLERRRYTEAEKLIEETTNASYLDEGCYKRTPLYILLCGIDQEEANLAPRNLYLAKHLIDYGANVNYRVPATYFGCEYMSPGKTALELVVDFYNEITKHESHLPESKWCHEWRLWDPIRYKVIGLDKQLVVDYDDIKQQLEMLLRIMLGQNGDPNIKDEYRMSVLHRSVIYSCDLAMTEIICETGVDVNAVDGRGNTPLIALCDAFPLGIQAFLDLYPNTDPYTHHGSLPDKATFLKYLLSLKAVKLDVQNKLGRTALFNCIVRGDLTSAQILLARGADTTLRGQVSESGRRKREISPLFAALCSTRTVRCHRDRYTLYMLREPQFMAHLVDAGHFTKSQITQELHENIDKGNGDLQHLKVFGTQTIHLMFGGTTSTLRQLATRAIFQSCLVKNYSPHPLLFFPKVIQPGFALNNVSDPHDYLTYVNHVVDTSVLENLISVLRLPKDALVHFEIELLRHRLLSEYRTFQWFRYYDEEMDGLYGEEGDSEESLSDEDDSDLEYW